MQVNSTSGAAASMAPTTATQPTKPKEMANYETFLQLLVTELRNQDPTKPMDPTQTVSQLATFSSVEQALRTNSLLGDLLAEQRINQAASLIGRTILASDGASGGVVKSVAVSAEGLVATLADGTTTPVDDIATIS